MNRTLLHRIILLGLILLVGFSTYVVIDNTANQELYGYCVLFQFLGIWALLVYVFRYRFRYNLNYRYLLLSSLSGFLLFLGFPPSPVPFFLFTAFIPLLILVDESIVDKVPKHRLWKYYFNTFLIWNILSTFWVANTHYAAGVFANVVNSLLMTIPIVLYRYVRSRSNLSVGLLSFAMLWMTFEYLHMRWDLYWPWLTLGNGLATMHWAIQWYEFTGVFGGSFWILLSNLFLFHTLRKERSIWYVAGWLVIPLLISIIMYQKEYTGPTVEVDIVTAALEPHFGRTAVPRNQVADYLLGAYEPGENSPDYIIYPETSFEFPNLSTWQNGGLYNRLFNFVSQHSPAHIITGMLAYRTLTDSSEFELPTTRVSSIGEEQQYWEVYNCAVQLNAQGELQEYYKKLSVPGAEYFPFRRIFFFMKPVVDQLGGSIEGYRTRVENAVFSSDKAILGPLICYESIFGEYTNLSVRNGAEALVIMTEDGWWDNTFGFRQHHLFAKLRAIENRRSIARAANMGRCAIITPKGDVLEKTKYGEATTLNGQVTLQNKITFYNRWGDMIGRLSLFISGLLLLRSLVAKNKT